MTEIIRPTPHGYEYKHYLATILKTIFYAWINREYDTYFRAIQVMVDTVPTRLLGEELVREIEELEQTIEQTRRELWKKTLNEFEYKKFFEIQKNQLVKTHGRKILRKLINNKAVFGILMGIKVRQIHGRPEQSNEDDS